VRGRHRHDGREVCDRIKAGVAVKRGVDGLRALGSKQKRVAVSGGTGDIRRAHVAACARTIFDDHRLPEGRTQTLRECAGHSVVCAARCLRHHDDDRLGWEGVLRRGGR